MRHLFLAAVLAVSPLAAAPALAATPVTETMTCPIGGGSFDFVGTRSYSSYGERPDGKPYGKSIVPPAIPECPDNGLVLYKDYTPDEVAKLEPLVASEAYQALRKEDTPYYRAYWLMKAMGLGPERYLLVLLQASWEADSKPDLRKRYLAELAEASAAVPAKPDDINWIGMEGRAINALRELGRFSEASARLAKMPLKSLDVPIPAAGSVTEEALAQIRARRAWLAYFNGLKTTVERRDSSIEPLDLLPRTVSLTRCIEDPDKLDEAAKAFCAKEEEAVAAMRVERENLAKEMEALNRSREASGR
ncbi:MAG: hypothetical protein ACJ8ER_05625 [Allosphingosinicella sp.]